MRIGFFTDSYWPRVDGVVMSVDLMRKALESLGHEVYIICPHYPGDYDDDERIIRVRGFDPLVLSDFTSRVSLGDRKSRKKIERLKLDIVHSHTQFGGGMMAYMIAKKQKIPHVSTYHTNYAELVKHFPYSFHVAMLIGAGFSVLYLKRLDAVKEYVKNISPTQASLLGRVDGFIRVFFDTTDAVIANAKHMQDYLESLELKAPVYRVTNGIDVSKFKNIQPDFDVDEINVVYVARLSAEKRQDTVIEAIAELRRNDIGVRLHILGDGPHREYYEQLVQDLDLKNDVVFYGSVSQHRMRKILSQSQIGVFASFHFDTYPLSLMEYLAAGLPIVYCDEHFDGMVSTSSAFKCGSDSHSFAGAIKKIMNLKSLVSMSRAAKRDASKHDINQRAKDLINIYQTVLSSHQPAQSARSRRRTRRDRHSRGRD